MAIAKARPTANSDGSAVVTPSRAGSYLEGYTIPVYPPRYAVADEGSYFYASNAADDTQITGHVAPAISDTDTKPILHLFNGGSKDIYLDFIAIYTVVANASATRVFFDAYTDQKGTTCKTSGGTVATLVNNTRSSSSTSTGAVLTAGAVVAAPVSSRKVLHAMVRPIIGIALDQYTFGFGNGAGLSSALLVSGGAVTVVHTSGPPVVIAAGGNFMFTQIGPSGATTAMTFEYSMGWWER